MIPSVETIERNIKLLNNGKLRYPNYSDEFACADFVRMIASIPESSQALSLQLSDCTERHIQYARFGDIVFNRNFSHCGISLGHPYVLHYTKRGVAFELYIENFAGGYAYGS